MGYWGVKSYENDDADDALDAGFEQVHGEVYEELMDDRNPLSLDQVQKRLADERTLVESVKALEEMMGAHGRRRSRGLGRRRQGWPSPAWSFAMPSWAWRFPEPLRERAIDWLEGEEIDWDEETKRRLRREKEIALLRRGKPAPTSGEDPMIEQRPRQDLSHGKTA